MKVVTAQALADAANQLDGMQIQARRWSRAWKVVARFWRNYGKAHEKLSNSQSVRIAELEEALRAVVAFKVRYHKGASTDELLGAIVAQFEMLQETAQKVLDHE